MNRKITLLAVALVCGGCLTVKPRALDRPSQLENQILGQLQQIERDLILESSVRGVQRPQAISPYRREAIDAASRRAFNRR